ncbi:hypothetical protein BGZ96_004177 [Linnemannia gamsii]|uniref:Bromodomain-containing protein n=1 Tax=Linnemannia gamsii TaxID=64522 RepID=A0ABQ7K6N2_9FUNG|nr:hypothetical protein BGZ96_004177 [Linnemannia gamsii]
MPPRKKSAAAKGPASIAEDLPLDNKQEAMATIIERLENLTDKSGRSVSELFLELPPREDYPDYYQIIQTPIAFDVIKGRLDAGQYTEETIGDFAKDLKTMITNAKTYNRDGSMVYRDATFLEFSADFCRRILDVIKDYEDKGGRQLAELFLELPSAKDYPDYYDEITKPVAIGDIEEKIDQREYPTLETFEKDINQMFDNAKQYNAEGSDVYLDAEELQQLFWKSIGKNGRGRQSKGKRPRKHENELQEVFHNGEVYKVGDFVHIRNDSDPSKPIIGLIFSLWEDAKGFKRVDAGWFLRPEQIIVPYASRFYPSEVVKMSERVDYFLGDVLGRCYVLQTKDYIRGRPLSWKEGQVIYVCEQRYNESYKSVTKIKNWPACLPPEQKHDNVALNPYPYPLVLKKLPSASMLNRAGKQDASEPVSRATTPQGSAYTVESEAESEESEVSVESEGPTPSASPSVSPEATPKMKPKAAPKKAATKNTTKPTPKITPKSMAAPKTTKTNKRKSSQIQPEALTAQPTKAAKIVKKAKSLSQEAPEPEESAPVRQPSSVTFHCVYPYPGTKTTCSEKFTSDEELNRHVSEKHTINAPRLSQVAEVSTNGTRVQKVSAGQSVEPSSPSTPTPVQTAAPAIMGQSQNAYQNNQYSAVNPYSTPSGPRPTVPSQQMYSTATYQQPPQQTMQYVQSSHQRGLSYPQEYSQSAMHAGAARPQGYAQNAPYSQPYGQPYGMQQQQTAYNSYGQPQFQQGYSTTGYPMQQQSSYGQAQPVSHQSYHQQQQQHYSQPYTTQATPSQSRHLPAPVPSQSQQSHPQDFAQQQRMVQQQQFAQQQQYMVQQQQQQFVPQTAGYHQRSLSHQSQSAHQPQQQQQQYQPPSPLTVVASQPYATVNPAYQQQAYVPPSSVSSVAYSTSGHGSSLSNASSHGSTTTLTTAMEGVGLGLSGVTNVEHGRVAAPTVMEGVAASGPVGYMNGNLQT